MKYSVILICFLHFLIACGSNNIKKDQVNDKKSSLQIELPELVYSDSVALFKAVGQLDKDFDFEKLLGKSGINILLTQSKHDSVFLDFSILDKEYFNLFLKKAIRIKQKGFIKNNERLLLVFDDVGLFENTKKSQIIDFGKQELEYPLLDDIPLYRYYLNKKRILVFVEESWFY